jgi:hypothetical protein
MIPANDIIDTTAGNPIPQGESSLGLWANGWQAFQV